MAVKFCKKNLPSSKEWEKVGSEISLEVGEYSPIITLTSGRFEGALAKVKDGVYRCKSALPPAVFYEQMEAAGFRRIAPNKCGLYGTRK